MERLDSNTRDSGVYWHSTGYGNHRQQSRKLSIITPVQQLLILMLLALSCSGCGVRAEAPMEHPQPYPSKTTGKEALKPSDGEDYWGYSELAISRKEQRG